MKDIAIITGASSGLGKEFTKQISKRKDFDEIWIIARRKENLEALAKEINEQGNFNIVRPIPMDISGKDAVLNFQKLLQEENEKLKYVDYYQ